MQGMRATRLTITLGDMRVESIADGSANQASKSGYFFGLTVCEWIRTLMDVGCAMTALTAVLVVVAWIIIPGTTP